MSSKTWLGSLFAAVFGRLTWVAPTWLRRLWAVARANSRVVFGALVLLAAGSGARYWYTHRPPPPNQITLTAVARPITAPPPRHRGDEVPPPAPLLIIFDASAAPLENVKKVVTSGVSIRPSIAGSWSWLTERTLAFTPKAAWPIGQTYTVALAPELVARENVVLETRELEIQVEPFSATLSPFVFYQDPVDASMKQVVGTFHFNYPVDPASFEKQLQLVSAPLSNPTQKSSHTFTVTYDDFRFEAFVRSQALPMPVEDHTAELTLNPGVKPEGSTNSTQQKVSGTTTIPGKGNKFHVSSAVVRVAPNSKGDPEQVMVFDLSTPVNEGVFAAAVKVWALPKDRPASKTANFAANYHWSASEVGPEVLKSSSRLKVTAVPSEHELGEMQSFTLDAKPGTVLFVRVEAGIEAFGGYTLLKPYEATLVVPEYPREIKIAHDGAVLSVTGDKKLTIVARGVPAFRVQLYRVQPNDLNHLITQAAGDFAHFSLRGGSFSEENISEVFREVHALDDSNPREAQYAAIDFAPYLKQGSEQRGMYFVRVEAWNPKTNQAMTASSRSDEEAPPQTEPDAVEAVDRDDAEPQEQGDPSEENDEGRFDEAPAGQLSDQRFVLLTDVGMVEKVDTALNHWVYVQSFRTGDPIGAAQIEVLAKNGTVVMRAVTDSTGAVTLSSLKDLTAEKTPVALVARHDGDVSFLPLNRSDRQLDFSRFEVGGVRTRGRAAALSAFAFSDRGLYRPGETAHLSTLVRAVDWSHSVKGTPLRCEVTDPRGVRVALRSLVLDATGLASIDFKTEENAPTGTYTLTVAVPQANDALVQLGSVSFRVEEFLPDRLRLTTRFEAPAQGWVTGSTLKALVELRNLFGTPAADHPVKANITLTPYAPRFSKYPEHQFFDPARAKSTASQALDDATTDAKGNVAYDIDLSAWAASTWQVSFWAEGFELGGGRSVNSQTTIIASPRKFMLGFKADGSTSFIKRGSARKVQLIAIDPSLTQIKVGGLKLVLVEQRAVSVLTRERNGSYRYQSVIKDVTKKSEPLVIDAAGASLEVPTSEVGTFFWSVRDADDIELLRVPFTIAGEANLAKALEKNAELKVSLDKAEYEPGDTMTVQITAPYAGAGVITVERDAVLVHKSFKTTTTSTVQTIEVPAGLEVNGYVNVSFVRALDSPELYVSPLSYGVVPFSVLKKSQHLQLSVSAPELTKPGRPMAITYKTDRPSKIVVFAVDEGILQVAKYETPDPLGFFLEKRALEVTTRQIVDLLLPEFRLAHAGKEGGDGDAALARNVNPFKRKTDTPAVYWSGVLDAGPTAKLVSFTVPESFSGSLRVMAVAASAEAIAAAHTSTTVRGPFVVNPNTPTFVSPGDTFVATAAISNNVEGSGEHAEITVTLKPNAAFELAAGVSPTQTLTIAERREAVVSYAVKATEFLGDGELQFLVSGVKQEATRTAHVSIRPSSAFWVAAQAGTVKGSSAEISPRRKMFDAFATRHLSVSVVPLGMGIGLVDYLEHYPHLCSEQLASRAVPGLVFSKRPEWGYDPAKASAAFQRASSVLRSRQNDQGQFGYWAANSFVSEPLDVFITLMLTEAKDRGVGSANDVRIKALSNLTGAQVPVSDMNAARLRAFALYVMARNAMVSPAPTAQLAEFLGRQKGPQTADLAFAYLAATYQLTNNPKRAQELISRFTPSDSVVPNSPASVENTLYQAQVLYLVAKHFPERLETVGPKGLTLLSQSMTSSGLYTMGAAWSLYGLDAYSTAMQTKLSDTGLKGLAIEAKDPAGAWQKQAFTGTTSTTLPFTSTATSFRVSAPEGVLLFYSLTEGGFDREAPKTAIAEGLEVLHTFENDQGQAVSHVALGEELNVHLRVRSSQPTSSQVALVDLLPSGFDVVLNPGSDQQGLARLVKGSATWQPNEVDIREDRVNFYGSTSTSIQELTYRIKAVAKGTFVVAPAQASDMDHPDIRARSTGGVLVVE